MSKSNRSARRLIENHAIYRGANEAITNGLEKLAGLAERHGQGSMALDTDRSLAFYCECSNESCDSRVTVPIETYIAIHENRKRFVVLPEHVTPEYEKVIERHKDYIVIEKFELPDEQPDGLQTKGWGDA